MFLKTGSDESQRYFDPLAVISICDLPPSQAPSEEQGLRDLTDQITGQPRPPLGPVRSTRLNLTDGLAIIVPGMAADWHEQIMAARSPQEAALPAGPDDALAAGGQALVHMINGTIPALSPSGTPARLNVTDAMIKLLFHWAKKRRLPEVAGMANWDELANKAIFKFSTLSVTLCRSPAVGWEF